MTNIKAQRGNNQFQWSNLTEGKLLALARITKVAANNGDALANDCYHEILNFFYATNKQFYEIVK